MFSKLVKTHDIKGAAYKKVIDWDAVWGTIVLGGVAFAVLAAIMN